MANGYKRIGAGGRSGRLAVTYDSLWQGPDHLLMIERDHYGETYKRFYFADIESFTIRRTNRQQHYAIALAIVLAIFIWIALVTTVFVRAFTLFWIVFFLVLLIYNWVKGPTCATHITTAVQREQLPAVTRVRKAETVLQMILDGAQRTQGVLTPDMARVRFELENAPPGSIPPPIPPAA